MSASKEPAPHPPQADRVLSAARVLVLYALAVQVEHFKLDEAPYRLGTAILRFDKAWWSACRAADIPDRVEKRTLPNGKEITKVTCGRIFHDFRRTAVRNLENAGVPRSQAMRLVGHKTEAIYNRYAISNENDLREAVRKLDAAQKA